MPVSSNEFLEIQLTIECGFNLKRVRDMIKTCSQEKMRKAKNDKASAVTQWIEQGKLAKKTSGSWREAETWKILRSWPLKEARRSKLSILFDFDLEQKCINPLKRKKTLMPVKFNLNLPLQRKRFIKFLRDPQIFLAAFWQKFINLNLRSFIYIVREL